MVFFRCTVGGSGKGNTVTVTCAEEFAGLTITLAKTGKTYTKTCPSTSPYVVTFYGVENGNYTVSATYGGRTYSEAVEVKDISCALNYGFGWVTWVNTAQYLDASDYASLDEVLEDEAAIRELFLEHACVDYMAEAPVSNNALETIINNDLCAKWINLSDYALDFLHANEVIADLMDEADKYGYGEWALMPQVPTMKSNTAPYGEVIPDVNQDSYKMFDGSTSTGGKFFNAPTGTSVTDIVGKKCLYHFPNATVIKKMDIQWGSSLSFAFDIVGGNDTTNLTTLYTTDLLSLGNYSFDIPNDTAYEYYGIRVANARVDTEGTSGNITEIQFYAWAPKGNVPVMTGASAPYGTASASSTYSGRDAYKAFDGNSSTMWGDNDVAVGSTCYIQYKFTNPVCAKRLSLNISDSGALGRISAIQVQGSNDGTNWSSVLNDDTSVSETVVYNTKELDNDDYYLYYRCTITKKKANASNISLMQFYGRELKVSVPVMTSNTAPYGEASAINTASDLKPHDAYQAFCGLIPDFVQGYYYWLTKTANSYVQYEFEKKVVAKLVTLETTGESSGTNISITVSGVKNGVATDIDSTLISSVRNAYSFLVLDNDNDYDTYRLTVNSFPNGLFGCGLLQFYGLDYSEKEFESGATKKWLYDHGVELETVTQYRGAMEKESYRVKVGINSGASSVGCQTDLTPYSLARMKAEDWYKDGTANVSLIIINNSTQFTTLGFTLLTEPYNTAVDISNINDVSLVCGQSDGSASRLYFTELWLE